MLLGGRTKRWVCDLRPYGHPDVQKKGWGEVMVERSPAGEEARLIAFCLWLLVFAAWGVVRSVSVNLSDSLRLKRTDGGRA